MENGGTEDDRNLLLAVKEGRYEEADIYIRNGADPRWSDEDGMNSMDYSLINGNKDFYKHILKINRTKNVASVLEKLPILREQMKNIPDCTFKFRWKVYSWVPLVTKFCPFDVWTVYKYGNKVRVDSTLADWSGLRWLRGDVSLYIDTQCEDLLDSFILVDNTTKEVINLLREMQDSDEFDMDVDNLLKMDLIKGKLHPETYNLSRSKGAFGRKVPPKTFQGMWEAKEYDLNKVKVSFIHYYFEDFGLEPAPVYYTKHYSAKFWCSKQFPVQPDVIAPFLEAVTPFTHTADNILHLLGMFNSGTPIKAEVSVFPTVKFAFEFTDYSDNAQEFKDLVNYKP